VDAHAKARSGAQKLSVHADARAALSKGHGERAPDRSTKDRVVALDAQDDGGDHEHHRGTPERASVLWSAMRVT
jgi:hypothetical protein